MEDEAKAFVVLAGHARLENMDDLALIFVDASVMPNIIRANLNGPTQMIAARAADFVLGRPQLPPFRAKFSFT